MSSLKKKKKKKKNDLLFLSLSLPILKSFVNSPTNDKDRI